MPIDFTCPHCGKITRVADQYAGQAGPCAACGQTITIPALAETKSPRTGADAAAAPARDGANAAMSPMSEAVEVDSAAPVVKPSGSNMLMTLVIVLACVSVGLVICVGGLAALLLPAVQAARESARRMSCTNNLRQIAIAFHNYHDVYGTFPPAYIPDEEGRPMHSWRVLILPFMESSDLYDRYDFEQPWDSPHNQSVVDQAWMPTYVCPSERPGAGPHTNYLVVTGPGTMFEEAEGIRLRDITDGTSNTIMVVEVAGSDVHWAAPYDLCLESLAIPPSPEAPHSMSSRHPRGFNVAFADGSVRFIEYSIDPDVLRALLTPAGGEHVRLEDL